MFPSLYAPYFSPIIVIQVLCILHALKTGRREWLYILLFLPLIGAIIYFIKEILPGLRTDDIARGVQLTFMPNSRIKELERMVAIADTDTNKLNLASEYARQGQFDKAIALVRSCLTGIYAKDPGMMLELAKLLFCNKEFAESVVMFERVNAQRGSLPGKPEEEILYARALDGNNNAEKAEEEYKKVIRVHHSMEAMYYYGLLLKRTGRTTDANEQFNRVLAERNLHPGHIRRLNARWVQLSRKELSGR
jgi:hypothetical protein